MKTTRHIFGFIIFTAILFSGCEFDDKDIWRELDKHTEQIAELQKWSKTVNNNISSLQSLLDALQDNDYITGVTKVIEGGVEVGYTIAFAKSAPITIYHGKQGEKGNAGKTPVIGVKKDNDGKYYWTLDGTWLLDGQNKIPATGEKGSDGLAAVAPQLRIDPDTNYWEISTDDGRNWQSTGIKATGDKGDTGATGPQGDAIFAEDGIDYSHSDYVVFTLADGSTTITLSKYKTQGITFPDAPDYRFEVLMDYPASFSYAEIGTIQGIGIASTIPDGWEISFDEAEKKLNINATEAAGSTKLLLVATGDNGVSVSYWLTLDAVDDILQLMDDERFRNYCKEKFDSNEDGRLSRGEARAVTGKIDVSYRTVSSLKGIEFFTELTELSCEQGKITTLDVSKNTKLTRLSCGKNKLTTLDLSNNTALTGFFCYENKLESLDLTANTMLQELMCDKNEFTIMDLSLNMALEKLNCSYNEKLETLKLPNTPLLTTVYCYGNKLTTIDVSECPNLYNFHCSGNLLTTLDLSQNAVLGILYANNNLLTEIDVSTCTRLWILGAEGNDDLETIWVWNDFDFNDIPSRFTLPEGKEPAEVYKVKN